MPRTMSSPFAGTRVVVLGMLARMPVAGAVWNTVHYLVGLQRLGCDVFYVEAHARTPTTLASATDPHGTASTASFLARVMEPCGFGERWAFHALHDGGACHGLSRARLDELYCSADFILNLHGGTAPRPEHAATGRLVYLETDPVAFEVDLDAARPRALERAAAHRAFFTWGLNYGKPDCRVPLPPGIRFHITLPPVVLDLWDAAPEAAGPYFTTVGNWRQAESVVYRGETYHWSKHHELLRLLDLPSRAGRRFELALASIEPAEVALLEAHGWRVRSAAAISEDLDAYRAFIAGSRGELTVAKDQNVRLRSGWFSERSAQYLAAGRPVVTQDTGFGAALPTGEGLFAFTDADDVLAALAAIDADHLRHCRAAREIARAYFAHDVVLPRLLDEAAAALDRGRLDAGASACRATTIREES